MSTVAYRMVVLPSSFWTDVQGRAGTAAGFVRDALAIERRIPKGVNLESERSRYFLCCRRIQEAARESEHYASAVTLDEGYLRVLRAVHDRPGTRIGACFHSPEMMKRHIEEFRTAVAAAGLSDHPTVRARLSVLESAGEEHGLVETLEFLGSTDEMTDHIPVRVTAVPFGQQCVADNLTAVSREELIDISFQAALGAIERGAPINFSNQPHRVIAEVLHRIAYRTEPGQKAGEARIVYMDGSEAEPFPVNCLDPIGPTDPGEPQTILKAALISMRHLAMDEYVDIGWFRNRRVSMPRPFAETDTYCTEETIRLLAGLSTPSPLRLEMYQTGLETAIVGFYRGLVKAIRTWREGAESRRLVVVPRFLNKRSGQYEDGSVWS